eukprot:2782593-Amphidinium_carterae.1
MKRMFNWEDTDQSGRLDVEDACRECALSNLEQCLVSLVVVQVHTFVAVNRAHLCGKLATATARGAAFRLSGARIPTFVSEPRGCELHEQRNLSRYWGGLVVQSCPWHV